ncbi:MAG: hypothetical protein NTW87_06525 [Planctomycetota bacterium]|nr:hypothetical protein [Planctomycetota bacterium]
MSARNAVLVLAFLLSGAALAKEAPGIPVGTAAPALEGKAWVTADGKAPELQGKVYLVHFWFAG